EELSKEGAIDASWTSIYHESVTWASFRVLCVPSEPPNGYPRRSSNSRSPSHAREAGAEPRALRKTSRSPRRPPLALPARRDGALPAQAGHTDPRGSTRVARS